MYQIPFRQWMMIAKADKAQWAEVEVEARIARLEVLVQGVRLTRLEAVLGIKR